MFIYFYLNKTISNNFAAGVIFNNETAVESRNFPDNERIAGIGNHPIQFSSVSPPPHSDGHIPFSPPTTDMSTMYVPRSIQGVIAIDNMDFTPSLANKSSPEFKTLASSIESEVFSIFQIKIKNYYCVFQLKFLCLIF